MNSPIDFTHFRRPPLTAALIAVLFACASQAHAATTADAVRQPFRADPARRIFAQLPPSRAATTSAAATTIAVTNCDDDVPGSLRAAVAAAGSGDTIDLTGLTCATITLQTGAIPIKLDDLTLEGPGADALAIDGNALDRVFFHARGGTLTLHALTVRHGRNRESGFDVAGGGCIASAGYLVLDAARVRDCYAGGEGAYGGGIYAYSLTMIGSTLSGNTGKGVHVDAGTAAFGGGAFVYAMDLRDSTVSGNLAVHEVAAGRTSYDIGAGIITVRGGTIANSIIDSNISQGRGGGIAAFNSVAISNSTVSGNIAQTEIGGGLLLRWPATALIANSTFTANHAATDGGGIWLGVPAAELESSLVFGNTAGSGFANLHSPVATTISGANNLIGSSGPDITRPPDTLNADPLLGPLANNGGPTRTHALLRGSPAVDTGNNLDDLAFDQRGTGFPRVNGVAADIGAFEQQALPAPVLQLPVPALSVWMLAALFGLIAACAHSRLPTGARRAIKPVADQR